MRVLGDVEEDQVPGLGPDDRAVAVDALDALRVLIVGDDKLTARVVVGAEQQPG
jgi:hypothetical protein